MMNTAVLDEAMRGMMRPRYVSGAVLRVENRDGSFCWSGAAGNLADDSRYFIASVTKMVVTAVVLRLEEEGRLSLGDPIRRHLPANLVEGLHVLNGTDRSGDITIRHLMSNTSGLPDYFSARLPDGRRVDAALMNGKDEAWPLERTLQVVRRMKPRFSPGQTGKIAYSDTNYALLGRIIETISGMTMVEAFTHHVFAPLALADTYVFDDTQDLRPVPMRFRDAEVKVPHYMASIAAEGGIVSTASDMMTFTRAFFEGRLFPLARISELKDWKFIWMPGQFWYGIGLEKLWTPRIFSPLHPVGEVLGFWGQSGAFAFHHPESGLFLTGTANQLNGSGHAAVYRAVIRIVKAAQNVRF